MIDTCLTNLEATATAADPWADADDHDEHDAVVADNDDDNADDELQGAQGDARIVIAHETADDSRPQ